MNLMQITDELVFIDCFWSMLKEQMILFIDSNLLCILVCLTLSALFFIFLQIFQLFPVKILVNATPKKIILLSILICQL